MRRRADLALVAAGLVASRARAQAAIGEGRAFADDRAIAKPGALVDDRARLEIRDEPPWVSRAALKLIHGLDHFGLEPQGRVALDIGASTGGFTQVLLARGALCVHAVDVGRGQLAAKLRADPRVALHEGVNARDLSLARLGVRPQAITCDVSFISATQALPGALALAAPDAWACVLVKPQFEAGRAAIGKGGLVRDPAAHGAACARVADCLTEVGWRVAAPIESPITGGDGNREFLIAAER